MDSNASNASTSQVWQADLDTDRSTERPVARPKERATNGDLVHYRHVSGTVCANARRKLGRPEDDEMDQVDIYRVYFMTTFMWAAVHLGKLYVQTLRAVRPPSYSLCSPSSKIWSSINSWGRLEVKTVNWDRSPWMKSTFGTRTHCRSVRLFDAVRWRQMCRVPAVCSVVDGQNSWFVDSTPYRELVSILGDPVVFEWKIFQSASLGFWPSQRLHRPWAHQRGASLRAHLLHALGLT